VEPHADLANLNDDDALSLWVGRVARAHAHLEYSVYNVHRLLTRRVDRRSHRESVKGFDQLARECSELLRESDADRKIVAAGHSALLAARQATGERNRVVHDMWLPTAPLEDSGPARWNTLRRSSDVGQSYSAASSQDLTRIVDTHTLLVRTQLRVSGLFMALYGTWPTETSWVEEGTHGDAAMARYVGLMTDRFTLHANGDVDIT
jgi:hypothetical protein